MGDLKHDKKENDPRYETQIRAAEQEAEQQLATIKDKEGYCHYFWKEKKRFLWEKFGIKWKSPAELNPGIIFD